MKTDVPVEVVPVSLPWYRTRKFWAIVFILLAVWGIFFYFFSFPQSNDLIQTYRYFSLAFGSGLFTFIGSKFFIGNGVGEVLFTTIYNILIIVFLIKIFLKREVALVYPLLTLLFFVIGTLLVFQLIAGLN